jgi:phage terminase large subunit-like protein
MREFEAALEAGRLHFPANPILRWMASNATARQGANDKLHLGKQTAEAKIDGIVAMVMAFARQIATESGNGIDDYLRSLRPDDTETH